MELLSPYIKTCLIIFSFSRISLEAGPHSEEGLHSQTPTP